MIGRANRANPTAALATPRFAALDRRDHLLLVAMPLLLVVHLAATFRFGTPAAEDAAILLRYVEHLAQGHGLVWNLGEAPIDGATDFLLCVSIAALHVLGLPIAMATRVLCLCAHVLTVLIVYVAVRRLHGGARWPAVLSAVFLALGPGLRYVEVLFGTPFFALLGTTTWYLAYRLFRGDGAPRTRVAFAATALAMGLTRPEGVLIAALMLLALVATRGLRAMAPVLRTFAGVFGVPGALYFAWHWYYFGHPLPNPFYVHGGWSLYRVSLSESLRYVTALCLPFLPFLAAALLVVVANWRGWRRVHQGEPLLDDPQAAREVVFVTIVFGGFLFMWVMVSSATNWLMRFQYMALPLLLLAWPGLLGTVLRAAKVPKAGRGGGAARRLAVLATALFCLVAVEHQLRKFASIKLRRDGTLEVARILADYDHGYTVAVTNAGVIPYYSGWRALDAWGLNDAHIARQRALEPSYLAQYRPAVIQFDAPFSPLVAPAERPPILRGQTFFRTCEVLRDYAESHDYVLAAAFGLSPFKTHHYYVRRDLPECDEIVQRIRGVHYRWTTAHAESGERAINYVR